LIGLARHAGELNDIIAALKSHKASLSRCRASISTSKAECEEYVQAKREHVVATDVSALLRPVGN
jgi:hypothetical protein